MAAVDVDGVSTTADAVESTSLLVVIDEAVIAISEAGGSSGTPSERPLSPKNASRAIVAHWL